MIVLSDLSELWWLWLLFAVIGGIGIVLVHRAYAAARSAGSASLSMMAGGLGALTVGTPAAWTGMYVASEDMLLCTLVSVLATLVGASLLLGSIYLRSD